MRPSPLFANSVRSANEVDPPLDFEYTIWTHNEFTNLSYSVWPADRTPNDYKPLTDTWEG